LTGDEKQIIEFGDFEFASIREIRVNDF